MRFLFAQFSPVPANCSTRRRLIAFAAAISSVAAAPVYAGGPARDASQPTSFLLAATTNIQAPEEDPLPAKSPDQFNPDPGGYAKPSPKATPPPEAPVVPDLFEPVLPPPPPTKQRAKIPYKLRLPRHDLVSSPFVTTPLPYPQYQLTEGGIGLLPNEIPQTNRWRIPFGQFTRYADSTVETPYRDGPLRLFDPYKASLLKGDAPIIGEDIFLSVLFQDQAVAEFRRVPVGSGVSSARFNSAEFFGQGDSYTLSNNLSATIEIFKGETAFKPIDWAIRLTPVFNINFTETAENGLLNPDPRGPNFGTPSGVKTPVTVTNPGDVGTVLNGNGLKDIGNKNLRGTRYDQRTRETVSLEEAFVEIHLRDLSDNYDFISTRIGSQQLNADFRGFVFDDTNTGIRVFGNYDNNRLQYNAAWFDQREKDTFSGLNNFSERGQDIFVANVFRQDALNLFLPATNPLALGYTAELSMLVNLDHGDLHNDKNGFLVRPAALGGPLVPHDVNVVYLGFNGDGHIGWLNISDSFYEALGHDDQNGLAGHGVDINAQQAAIELSFDKDYIRPKFSLFYASGDSHPNDSHATGFDSILDSPTFIGNPFSFYARQGIGLANTAVSLKQPDSLLLDLRSSKTEGQSNFVNPGTFIVGLGLDANLTQKLKMEFNANYIRFVHTAPVKEALFTDRVDAELGYDISLGFVYRPTLTQNIVINAGFGIFLPGKGYRDIYSQLQNGVPGFTESTGNVDSFLYSGIIAVTLRY